jgi:preprotein translocase subunit SecB
MKSSSAAKSSSKRVSKKEPAPKVVKTPDNPFLVHWVRDASLEAPQSPLALPGPGERELEFSATARHFSHPDHPELEIELRLRSHITHAGQSLLLADLAYAGIVNIEQLDQNIAASVSALYQLAKPVMQQMLAVSGHQAPLPEKLEAAQS